MSYSGLGTTVDIRPATVTAVGRCATVPPPADCWTCEPGMRLMAATSPGVPPRCTNDFGPTGSTLIPRPAALQQALPQYAAPPEALQAARDRALRRNVIVGSVLLLGAVAGGAAGRRLAPKNQIVGVTVGGVAGAAASFGGLAFYALMNMGHG